MICTELLLEKYNNIHYKLCYNKGSNYKCITLPSLNLTYKDSLKVIENFVSKIFLNHSEDHKNQIAIVLDRFKKANCV